MCLRGATMRSLILSGIATAALAISGAASAADMPVKAPIAAPPAWSWTGFYIGVHGGGGWSDPRWTSDFNCAVGVLCEQGGSNISGWVGGGQLGYRWQFNQLVFGLEGTFAAADINGHAGQSCTPGVNTCIGPPGFSGMNYLTKINEQATATAQLGFAWDHSLFYAKGGWAGANVVRNASASLFNGQLISTGDLNQRVSGWTAGLGWEYLLTRNVSLGVEYDFLHFSPGSITTIAINGGFRTTQTNTTLDVHEVVARLNFHLWP